MLKRLRQESPSEKDVCTFPVLRIEVEVEVHVLRVLVLIRLHLRTPEYVSVIARWRKGCFVLVACKPLSVCRHPGAWCTSLWRCCVVVAEFPAIYFGAFFSSGAAASGSLQP